nr:hypothetical protein [Evansella caseinilytica]
MLIKRRKISYALVSMAMCALLMFVVREVFVNEYYEITEIQTSDQMEYYLVVESNKIIRPTFRQAVVSCEGAVLTDQNNNILDFGSLEAGKKVRIVFDSFVAFSDPPAVGATKIMLLN